MLWCRAAVNDDLGGQVRWCAALGERSSAEVVHALCRECAAELCSQVLSPGLRELLWRLRHGLAPGNAAVVVHGSAGVRESGEV